jgi:hypothetical protein
MHNVVSQVVAMDVTCPYSLYDICECHKNHSGFYSSSASFGWTDVNYLLLLQRPAGAFTHEPCLAKRGLSVHGSVLEKPLAPNTAIEEPLVEKPEWSLCVSIL